ncbi:hypothetical protein TWF730_007060 [Orbilia blumenaviensis]|uniref:F-box domain-containing protein n=1 Tax=Orbilia blumenaviensis TaxID=1796055 RepID=A0AAV9VG45_9PEZI
MARYSISPDTMQQQQPSKAKRLEEKAANAVRRIKGIRMITPTPSNANATAKKSTVQNTTSSTPTSQNDSRRRRDIIFLKTSSGFRNLISPLRQRIYNSDNGTTNSLSYLNNKNTAAHKVLFVPELLEVILSHVPSLQVLTSIRQVHPFFKDLVHTSPVLAWQTWTSKALSPPRRIVQRDTPSTTAGLGLYTISNSIEKPPQTPPASQNTTTAPSPTNNDTLELCALLHPILSKWWKTIARNTTNYRFFQVDSCVYNRFFPPDLLRSINFTRPAIHVDDLVLSFTSTYAFLSYGCTQNISLEDRDRDRGSASPQSSERNGGEMEDDLPGTSQTSPEDLIAPPQHHDMSVTIEKLLRMMWIPLSETLRRSRDEKFLRLSGLKYTRTMTVTVRARRGDRGEERGVAELNLECMEPYDVSIRPLF